MDKNKFWNQFQEEMDKLESEKLSEYKNRTNWTKIIIPSLKNIIESNSGHQLTEDNVDDEERLVAEKEFFRIDLIGYKDRKSEITKSELNPHLWDLEIAIEHENKVDDWSNELIKLMYIRCPLKVIISYRPFNKREIDLNILNHQAKKMMEMMHVYDDFIRSNETLLIILGNASSGSDDGYEAFDYRCYEFYKATKEFVKFES